ncbi:MAG: Cytochrome c oxidase subunit 5A [Thelocarpon superellum]|nr:MAG: Cytochrome c oxidase subunit 5A [Thelocarpon superellum]
MLRSSVARSGHTSATSLLTRRALPASRSTLATCLYTAPRDQQSKRGAHAISNPTLANIEKRWELMPPQEQADLWMQLRDRMKAPWAEMTLQEKKAAYWIAFGPHGPRALPSPGEGWTIFSYTMIGMAAAFVLMWGVRSAARPAPSTMNKEWQEQTNEYLKSQRAEPITGISSEGYEGKGQVQSKPKGKE